MDIRKFLKRTEPATTSTAVNSSSGAIDESTLLSDSEIMQEDTEFVNVQKDIKITSSTCQSSKSYRRLIKPEYLDTYGIADVRAALCVVCNTPISNSSLCKPKLELHLSTHADISKLAEGVRTTKFR